MFKTRMAIVACAAVCGLSLVPTSTAVAVTPGWMVNGKALSGSKAFATTAGVDETSTISGGSFSLKCTGAAIGSVGTEISSPSMAVTSIVFHNCSSTTTNCFLSSNDGEEIGTTQLLLEATLEGTLGVRATLKPKTGLIIATLKFEGENCSGSGVKSATGSVITSAPTDQDERTLQLASVNATASEGTLKSAGGAITVKGSALLKLATAEPWSYL